MDRWTSDRVLAATLSPLPLPYPDSSLCIILSLSTKVNFNACVSAYLTCCELYSFKMACDLISHLSRWLRWCPHPAWSRRWLASPHHRRRCCCCCRDHCLRCQRQRGRKLPGTCGPRPPGCCRCCCLGGGPAMCPVHGQAPCAWQDAAAAAACLHGAAAHDTAASVLAQQLKACTCRTCPQECVHLLKEATNSLYSLQWGTCRLLHNRSQRQPHRSSPDRCQPRRRLQQPHRTQHEHPGESNLAIDR